MKKILAVLILIFTLPTPSWADDIRDFQIEGMSVGDSALDYFNKKEIKKFLKTYYAKSKKFYENENESTKYETYDGVQFTFLQLFYRCVTTRLHYVTFARRRWTDEKTTVSLYKLKDYI